MVEKFIQSNGNEYLLPYFFMELKSEKGDRFEKALHQTVAKFQPRFDQELTLNDYVVVQRGTKIAFFDYHNNSDEVRQVTQSVFGCTSLTQPFLLEQQKVVPMPNPPNDL